MMLIRHPLTPLAAGLLAAGFLVACGGGGSDATTGSATVSSYAASPAIYITDAAAKDYAKVWVDLDKITAVASDGREVTLWNASDLLHVNLAELQQMALWLNQPRFSTEVTYTGLRIYVADSVTLETADAKTLTGSFPDTLGSAADGSAKIIAVALPSDWASHATLLLDFDLSASAFDEATSVFTPVVTVTTLADRPDIGSSRVARLKGEVTAVSDTGFTVTLPWGNAVTVVATDTTVFNDERAAGTGSVAVGDTVEVTATPAATSGDPMTALTVHILDATTARAWVEGTIAAISATSTNTTLTLDVTQTSVADGIASPLTVTFPTASLVYVRGAGGALVAGAKVQLRGTWTSATSRFSVNSVEVDGAKNACGGRSHHARCRGRDAEDHPASTGNGTTGANFATISAQITAVSGSVATVTVNSGALAAAGLAGSSLSVDFSNALGRGGAASCLVTGAVADFAGELADTGLTASRWRILTPASGSACYAGWRRHH